MSIARQAKKLQFDFTSFYAGINSNSWAAGLQNSASSGAEILPEHFCGETKHVT